jgi:hypothetical protein
MYAKLILSTVSFWVQLHLSLIQAELTLAIVP